MKTIFSLFFLLEAAWLWGQVPRLVVPIGHTGIVNSVAFSPDGKYVLTGSDDQTAKLWDRYGHQIVSFSGHISNVSSVAFSPNGQYVLTGSWDKTAKLWDLSGQQIRSFVGHVSSIYAVAFSPDGKYILTGSEDQTAKLWDLSGQQIQSFHGHTLNVSAVAFSPDGQRVLTGSWDTTAKLWDLSGNQIQSFEGHKGIITSVAFSPDGQSVLTAGSDDYTAKLWDLSGKTIQSFYEFGCVVTSVTFSPDGKFILAGSFNRPTYLWDLAGNKVQSFESKDFVVSSVDFSPDGKYILMGCWDHTAKLWNLSGHIIQSFDSHASDVSAVAFSPDEKYLLTGSENRKYLHLGNKNLSANLWDLARYETRTFKDYTSDVSSVDFSPDGKYILTGKRDGTAILWDSLGDPIQKFEGHVGGITSVAFSLDGKCILTGSEDFVSKLWTLSGQQIQSFKGHLEGVTSVAFSRDGKHILTGSRDNTAKLWDLSGRQIHNFVGHTSYVSSVDFSPDGNLILTGSGDHTVNLWDSTGRQILSFRGHASDVSSVTFSADGKYCLSGSWDHTAKLWDLSGNQIRSFVGHTKEVSSVAISPNNQYILTGSYDNTTKLWDLKSGQTIATLVTIDSTDWVVATPSGLFDASPGAMKLMYYIQGLEVIELEQLKERYYEPGLLSKIMGFDKNELRNVANFNQVALYPEIKAKIEKSQLAVELTERSGGLGKLSCFINNKEVQEDINPKRLKTLSLDLNIFSKYYQTDTLNTIALRAYNQEGWLKSQAYELIYRPANSPGVKTIPHLYAIVVGTSNYAGDRLDLRFADLDAEAMAKAFQSTGSALFGTGHTSVQLLSTSAAAEMSSKDNIRQAFSHIAANSSPADVLVVYFSGHGIAYGDAEKAQFYYLTKDIGSEDLSDPEIRSKYAISSDTLTKWLTDIPAKKQVMILDACNAGKVLETLAALDKKELDPSQIRAFDRMKDRTGMFILTGSAADQVSYEASQYGQGLLTYSLLQGMSGLALKENKYVDVNTLFQYSCDQVPLLAQGIGGVQKPILASPGGASFDIGIVQPGAISVAPEKPVFIRNMFQEETSFDDVLGLTDALEALFQRITAKGARAEVIFVDVKEYGAAYSMKGRYTITGDAVEVRVRVFKGKTPVGKEFKVNGSKDAVEELAEGIFRKVGELVGIRR
jgi:WD40 repeat protein